MTVPSQFGPGVFFLCHVLVPASNHWCVGELLPPVGTIHGVWGTQNRLEEVLVDLQWEREGGGRYTYCLAAVMKSLASTYSEFNKRLQSKPGQSLPRIQTGLHSSTKILHMRCAFLLGNDCPHILLEDWVKLLCKLNTLWKIWIAD